MSGILTAHISQFLAIHSSMTVKNISLFVVGLVVPNVLAMDYVISNGTKPVLHVSDHVIFTNDGTTIFTDVFTILIDDFRTSTFRIRARIRHFSSFQSR